MPNTRPTPPGSSGDRDEIRRWVLAAAAAADDKLGTDTVVIDVGEVFSLTDYFLITSGRNARQVRAIAEEIESRLTAEGGPRPVRIEGRDEYRWLLMDYGSFIVHVFDPAAREYYDLDRLWKDQPRVPLPEVGVGSATAGRGESGAA